MKPVRLNSTQLRPRLTSLALPTLAILVGFAVSAKEPNEKNEHDKPSIHAISVSPNPLVTGQYFTIAVTASTNVTRADATIDFHPGKAKSIALALAKQGSNWTGSFLIPADLDFPHQHKARAKVEVQVFDADRHKADEHLEVDVDVVSISAVLAGGVLTITGDDQDNTIIVSRDPAGMILINGGAVPVTGGIPNVTNTALVRILGLKGKDILEVSDSNGPMPSANLLGGEDDDTLTGSASADVLDGGPGNDLLSGRGGIDTLFGGTGHDTLIGGPGPDQLLGEEGDDQFVWNPGDGNDLIEGQEGVDTMIFNGSNIAEAVDLSANGPRLRFFRNVGNITMDCAGVERVTFRALGGADQVVVNDLTGTDVAQVFVDLSPTSGPGDEQADTVTVNGTGRTMSSRFSDQPMESKSSVSPPRWGRGWRNRARRTRPSRRWAAPIWWTHRRWKREPFT
jgi:Ca2+-binding RTX toxin-like protein